MSIIERYVYRDVLRHWMAIFGVLIVIVISIRFVRYLGDAAAGKVGGDIVFQMLAFKLVTSLSTIVPLCLYLAVYTVINRMSRNNELTALAAAGVNYRYLLRAVLKLGLVFALATLVVTSFAVPWAEGKFYDLRDRARAQVDITGIVAGRFKEFSDGEKILYVEDVAKDSDKMENVFLQIREEKKFGVLTSNNAYFETDPKTGDRFVVFTDGHRYLGSPGKLDFSIAEYEKYAVRIDRSLKPSVARLESIPTPVLWLAKDARSSGELQWRMALPLATVLLGVMSASLARSSFNYGYMGLMTMTLIYFLYNNLLGITRSLVIDGKLSPAIGLWWVHGLAIAIIAMLLLYPAFSRWCGRTIWTPLKRR